jgi:hypothetical protein
VRSGFGRHALPSSETVTNEGDRAELTTAERGARPISPVVMGGASRE